MQLASVPGDEALMMRVARGDDNSADLLVRRYQQPLFAFLYRLTVNQADAEDLFQETWLRTIRYRHTFDPTKKFSTWLFQIAVNCTRDFFHKKPAATVAMQEDISIAGDHEMRRLEDQELAAMIVERLPLPQREVLVLRYFHHLKEKEIAELLDVPLGTVKSRLHKIMHHLQQFYGESDERTMDR